MMLHGLVYISEAIVFLSAAMDRIHVRSLPFLSYFWFFDWFKLPCLLWLTFHISD